MRTAEENAVEFGRHERFGGWASGLLVACSVEPRAGQGRLEGLREVRKLSAAAFAATATVSDATITKYYNAWERAAKRGVVEHASRLSPSDVDEYEWNFSKAGSWDDFYDGTSTSNHSVLPRVLERAQRDPEYARQLAKGLMAAPSTAAAVTNASLEHHAAVDANLIDRRDRVLGGVERGFRNAFPEFDQIVHHVRTACGELREAIRLKEDGVKIVDRAKEREALEQLDRLRELYSTAVSRFTQADEAFLEAIGVEQ